MYQSVLDFWFTELTPAQWWVKDAALDAMITERFTGIHTQAHAGELSLWRESAQGSLAEIIILDQFSRNIYRDQAKAFACDPMALVLAQNAIDKGFDSELPPEQRSFMYLPFMHSESRVIHEQAVKYYQALGNAANLEFELKHHVIIERFGRYPHRNEILGRTSTAQEIAFLLEPDSHF